MTGSGPPSPEAHPAPPVPPSAAAGGAGTPRLGLSGEEAARRLSTDGPNRPVPVRGESVFEEVLESLREPLVVLLVAVGVVYAAVGEVRDALIVLGVIVTVAVAETWTERRAGRAVAALERLAAPRAHVWRDGVLTEVAAEAVVRGDVLALGAGSRIPADAQVLHADALAVDESLVTGEAAPVDKDATGAPHLLAATVVVRGRGRAVVTATGTGSTLGRITALVAGTARPRTPLQQQLARLARILLVVALALSVVVPVLGVVVARQPVRDMVLTGLTLAFATIPEELPILVVVVLGLGAYGLARRGAIVRRLVAAETLGSITVLCTDKTGTLTENRVSVADVVTAPRLLDGADPPRVRTALLATARAAGEHPDEDAAADPVDMAISRALGDDGDEPPVVVRMPFDAERRTTGAVVRDEGGYRVAVKGAAEAVVARCTRRRFADGTCGAFDPADRGTVLRTARESGAAGRVVAVASRRTAREPTGRDDAERDLCLEGIVVLADPLRAGVSDAVAALGRAGVAVAMITGDQRSTAMSVARAAGLRAHDAVDVDALAHMDGDELARVASTGAVFTRARPEDKLRIVAALRDAGAVVAVTGDGVNDAPALRAATIGVAMGRGGTDVAREAADLVLTDDDIATVVRAVHEGRRLFDNLRKAVRFYLAVKVALVAVTLGAVLARVAPPFAPVQIIVLELFMDLGASTAFVAQAAEADVMDRPPRDPRARFLDRGTAAGLLTGAAVLAAVTGAAYAAGLRLHGTDGARTMALSAWFVGHVAVGVAMSSTRGAGGLRTLRANLPLAGWVAAAVAFAVALVALPPLGTVLHAGRVSAPEAAVTLAGAAAVPWVALRLLSGRAGSPVEATGPG